MEKVLRLILTLALFASFAVAAVNDVGIVGESGSDEARVFPPKDPDESGRLFPRGEDKVKIYVRKEYLDDDTLDEYLGVAHGGYDIGSEAAFRYLDYEVTINIVFDIPFEDGRARDEAIEELRWKRDMTLVWAEEVLAKAPEEKDAYIILALKAEMQHEHEMEEAVEEFERYSAAALSAYEYGGPVPEKPVIRCDGSKATLETLVANCRDRRFLAYAWYFLAVIAQEEGKTDEAEDLFLTSYELARDRDYFADICFRLGEMAVSKGEYGKAISFYGDIPADSSNYGPAVYGICYSNYALAGLNSDPTYDEHALDAYVKLDEKSGHTAITEHCSRVAAASSLRLAGGGNETMVNAHSAIAFFDERFSGRLSGRGAAALLRAIAQNFDTRRGDYAEAIVVYVALLDRYPGYDGAADVIEEISRVISAEPERESWYRQLFLARYGRETPFYDLADDVTRTAIDRFDER